jgi:hypothetical protein
VEKSVTNGKAGHRTSGTTTIYLAGNIPETCHLKVRELTHYWLSIRPADSLPGRQHLDPCDIPKLLANILLIDICSSTSQFTWRLMGTSLVRIFSRDHTGLPFEVAYHAGKSSNAYRDMCEMIRTKQPRWRRGSASFMRDRDYLTVERVILPLARDGNMVDMAVGMILAHSADGEVV